MSEMRALVAVFGAIDQRLEGSPEERKRVALLLPEYANPEVEWYDRFVAWVRETRHSDEEEPFPSFAAALEELAAIEPEGRMVARRLLAATEVLRAMPEILGEDPEQLRPLVAGMLMKEGIADADHADELLDFLAFPEEDPEFNALFPPSAEPPSADDHWNALVTRGLQRRLLNNNKKIGWRPCTGTLVEAPPHGDASQLVAKIHADVPYEQALGFLNPANWEVSDFWCTMELAEDLGDNRARYREVVSIDCDHKETTWMVEANLEFTTVVPNEAGRGVPAFADYDIAAAPPPSPHVQVDYGMLTVLPADDGGVFVEATKTIRFAGPFSGEALALLICALGYTAALEDLVQQTAGLPGPGRGAVREPRGAGRPAGGRVEVPQEDDSLVDDVIDGMATWAKRCIDDCAAAAAASADKVDKGEYDAHAFTQDVASMWTRMLREGARGVSTIIETSTKHGGRG